MVEFELNWLVFLCSSGLLVNFVFIQFGYALQQMEFINVMFESNLYVFAYSTFFFFVFVEGKLYGSW